MRIIKTLALILAFGLMLLKADAQAQKPEVVVQSGHARETSYAIFSPDKKTIASVARDAFAGVEVKVWNAETGKLIYTFSCAFYRGNPLVFYSRSGKYLATYEHKWKSSFDVWNLETGGKLAEDISPEPEDAIWTGLLKSGEFSPSLTKTSEKEYDKIYHRSEQESIREDFKKALKIENNKISVFDNTSKEKLLEFGQTNKIVGKAITSSDGKKFAFTIGVAETINGFEGIYPITGTDKAKIIVWTISATPKLFEGEFDFLSTPFFSPDGKLLAATASEKTEVVNEENEKEEKTKYTVIIWNTENGNIIRRIENESFYDFNENGNAYLTKTESEVDENRAEIKTTDEARKTKLYNAQTGTLIKTFDTTKVEISQDKKNLIVWNDSLNFDLFSSTTGLSEGKYAIPNRGYTFFHPNSSQVFLVKEFNEDSIKLFNFKLQKLVKNIPLSVDKETFERPVETVHSPDGDAVASLNLGGNRGYSGSLYNLQTGKSTPILYTASLPAFNQKGNLLAVGSLLGDLAIYDAGSGTAINNIKTKSGGIGAVTFHPNNFVVTSINGDNSIRIYSSDAKLLATLVINGENDWLVTTPDGYFDGTSLGWEKIGWRFQNNPFEIISIEPYFNDFFYPNLLQDVLAGKSPQSKAGQELEKIDRRQPKVEIAAINGQAKAQLTGQSAIDKRTINVVIEVADNNDKKKQLRHQETSGAQDLRLFRNGSLVKIWHDDVFNTAKSGCEKIQTKPNESRRVRCQTEISIIAGENNFTAYAFNASNVKSDDSTAIIEGKFPKKEGTLYVLAIGVNKYANASYNLNFAVPDVIDIGNAIKAEQSKLAADTNLKQYAETKIITLKDETATRENILLALNRFAKNETATSLTSNSEKPLLEDLCAKLPDNLCTELKAELGKIKPAEPEDALIVYFAGHGVSRNERFYLLPHNFTGESEKSFSEQGVSDAELNDYLERVDAGRLLMAIDACQSGGALGAKDAGRAPMNSKGLAQLAYDKGMYILTAAQSQEAALEAVNIGGKEIRHGLLTYSLLEGLKNPQADKDANRQLWEREWLDYATEQVPLLQREAMRQRNVEIKSGAATGKNRSDIVFLNGDNKNAKPEDRAVQTPRVFYKREASANPFVINKP